MPYRVAGTIWAIRITKTLTPEEEVLFKIPNTVCVYHAGGTRRKDLFQEKPHYHLYYNAGTEVVKEKVQEMIKSNEIVNKYYKASNGFWAVETDPGYDLKSYWDYVWRGFPLKRQRLVWWDIEEEQLEIPQSPLMITPGNIVATGPLDPHRGTGQKEIVYVNTVKSKAPTSAEKQRKFYEYCLEYYEHKPNKPKSPSHVCYLLVKYCEEKGFTPESSLSTWARFAYLNLLGKPERKLARCELASKLHEKFF